MPNREWVVCPKLSLDMPVKVDPSSCLGCWECEKAMVMWLSTLKTLPRIDQKEWLEKKARKKGLCPKVRNADTYCTAAKSYCPYNFFCSDQHPRTRIILAIQEERMLIVKRKDGTYAVDKSDKVTSITGLSEIKAVYDVQKKLVMVRSLVPVQKETEMQPPKLPANFKDLGLSTLLLSRGGKIENPVQLKDFLAEAEKDPNISALIVSKIYQPTVEIKLEPMTKPKPKQAKQSGGVNG